MLRSGFIRLLPGVVAARNRCLLLPCHPAFLTHHPSPPPQFTDQYRSLDAYGVCLVPGHVLTNGFTDGATAVCGGPQAGVTTFPLVDQSNSNVGRLLLWRGLNGYLYFSMLLDCAGDGSLVSATSPHIYQSRGAIRAGGSLIVSHPSE